MICSVTVADEAAIIRLPADITRIESEAFADLPHPVVIVIPTSADIDIADDTFAGSTVTIECPAGSPVEAWARAKGIPTVNP